MTDAALFDVLSAAHAAFATAVALVWAERGLAPREPLGARRVAGAGAAAVGATLVLCVAAPLAGLTVFGMIRFLYLTGVVAIPLAGLALLARGAAGRRPLTRGAAALASSSLLLAGLGVWMSFVEPSRLRTESASLDLATVRPSGAGRSGREAIRIGVLADLQCNSVGEHEERAIDELLATKPDLILVPGDLFHGSADEHAEWAAPLGRLLSRLDAPGGVFFVMGDVDRARTLDVLRKTRIRPLLDEVVRVKVRDRDVTIGGTSWNDEPVIRALEDTPGDGDVRILLTHRPDSVLRLRPRSRVDVTVAGHTHGGQVVVPGFGPPMTLTRVPRAVAAGGLHELDGNPIYVSRGVGMERTQAPRMRLFCPPEISVVTVTDTRSPRD